VEKRKRLAFLSHCCSYCLDGLQYLATVFYYAHPLKKSIDEQESHSYRSNDRCQESIL